MEERLSNSERIEIFVSVLAFFSTLIYFPIIQVLGNFGTVIIQHNGYFLFNICIFVLVIVCSLFKIVAINKGKVNRKTIYGMVLVLLIIGIYFFYGIFYDENRTFFSYFFLWSLPALLAGMYLKNIESSLFFKILECFSIIMIIGAVSSAIQYLRLSVSYLNELNFGGTNYQGLSYTASFGFGLLIYFVFLAPQKYHFKLFKTKVVKLFEIILSFGAIGAVLVSGGRGGFLLLLLNILVFIFFYSRKNKFVNVEKKIIIFLGAIGIILLSIFVLKNLTSNSLVLDSVERMLSYITPEGIDISKTSGRDTVYSNSIKTIKNSYFLGVGIFNTSAMNNEPYPHNFILETMIQAGFFYMILWLIIIFILCKKIIHRAMEFYEDSILVFMILYPLIFLFISGTYLWCGQLWFLLGLMYSERLNRKIIL